MVLCFEFLSRTALIARRCFSYGWTVLAQQQGHLCFSLPPQRVGGGWARGWEGTQTGQLTPADQRDVPSLRLHDDVVLSSKNGWPLLEDWLGISLLVRAGVWLPVNHFFSPFPPSLIKWTLSWPVSFFSHFCFCYSLPSPTGGGSKWVRDWWVLNCWPRWTLHSLQIYLMGVWTIMFIFSYLGI